MNSNQIVLVNPNQMKPVVAPLALDYLSQTITTAGFEVDILDLAFDDDYRDKVANYFAQSAPLAIGVTIRNTDDCYFATQDFVLSRTKQISDEIKKQSKAPIVLGGVAFSAIPVAIMRYLDVDFGIVGEGEVGLPKFLQCLRAEDNFSNVPGLVYKTTVGYRRNSVEYLDLSEISLASRGIIDNLRYFTEGGMAGFETKRGCNQPCAYCLDPVSKGRKIRMRQPQDVADELECLLDMGITHFHTCDSEFNIPPHHAQAVCEELVRRKLGERIQWYAYASPVPFSDNLAQLMKRAGCVGIDFGVDHGNDDMLKRLGRNFCADDLERTAQICHEHGIIFMYDLLLGGPGETQATLKETINLMKKIRPSRVGVALGMRIYPGTEMGKLVRKITATVSSSYEVNSIHGRIEDNPDFLEPVFYLSSELGDKPSDYVAGLVGDDEMFFFASPGEAGQDYNYNENSALVQAIRAGYRGAFWDILRRLKSEK
ncbi:TPA: radical SAM protein [Candidatus Poribacteria bacterium]|nr:radical SAM protein [Candidatus Poribacteria bacterium]